jgi:urease
MNLLPREIDKLLLLHQAGFLAQKRLARGCRLNLAEATALIATVLQELVRDGKHSVAELMSIGEPLSLSLSAGMLQLVHLGTK